MLKYTTLIDLKTCHLPFKRLSGCLIESWSFRVIFDNFNLNFWQHSTWSQRWYVIWEYDDRETQRHNCWHSYGSRSKSLPRKYNSGNSGEGPDRDQVSRADPLELHNTGRWQGYMAVFRKLVAWLQHSRPDCCSVGEKYLLQFWFRKFKLFFHPFGNICLLYSFTVKHKRGGLYCRAVSKEFNIRAISDSNLRDWDLFPLKRVNRAKGLKI